MGFEQAGKYLSLAEDHVNEVPVEPELVTAWAAVGILHALLEAQRPKTMAAESVEDRRLGHRAPDSNWIPEETLESFRTNQVQELEKLVQQWKDRCLKAEKARDNHYRVWEHAVQQRDAEAKNAMTLVRQLQEAQHEAARLGVYERTVDSLGKGTDGEMVQLIERLQRQLANQADIIRMQREELYKLKHRDGAEA